MPNTNPTSANLLSDLRSAVTSTFIRHGYSSRIVISDNSDATSQSPSGTSKLFIEVSFSSEIPLEVMMMDEVFATPITEFLKMSCFSSSNAKILQTACLYSANTLGSGGNPVIVIGDLVDHTEESVNRWRGVGKVGRGLIKSALASIGLSLGMGPRIKGPKEIETRAKLLAKH